MAALAATGALIVGGSAVAMVGSGNADPLVPVPAPVVGTTYVLPDLAPFTDNGTREGGVREVTDAFGAPTGGGDAALRLTTPGSNDKASIIYRSGTGSPLAEWIPTAAYSAYQDAADNPIQFPSLQLEVDFNGPAEGGFSTLTYEPVYNDVSTAPKEWHHYQAGLGDWCSTRVIPGVIDANQTRCDNAGDKPLSAYLASTGIVVTGVVINQGSGNAGLDAAVDLVSTPSTTYDFELTKPVVIPDPDPCEEPSVPSLPTEEPSHPSHPDEGQNGGGHEDGGNESHDNGGQDNGGQDDGGHEQPDAGHEDGGGHEQPDNGGHEDPDPQPEPCK
jgi:hypothetical protein